MNEQHRFDLSATSLKVLAMALMLVDHVGLVLFPHRTWMRVLGRLAFPIFAFQAAQGYIHTRDFRRYCVRLLLFALISELPFDLMVTGRFFSSAHQNVMFTLLLGLLALRLLDKKRYILLVLVILAADLLGTDYGALGVVMVLQFYLFRDKPLGQLLALLLINGVCYGGIQIFATAAVVPISLYHGRKGSGGKALQAATYCFYPVHMLLLALL